MRSAFSFSRILLMLFSVFIPNIKVAAQNSEKEIKQTHPFSFSLLKFTDPHQRL
jgi:hypothetical protein